MLSASPPTIRPRLIEGRSNRSEDSRANGSDSIWRKTSIAFSTALSPSQGVEPWAAVPVDLDPHREHALGLDADVQVGGLAGDREVADVALLDEVVGAALLDLLGLLVGDADEVHAHALLRGQVVERAHHRREAALHVVGAAAVEAVALDARLELLRARRAPRRGARADDRRAARRARPWRPARAGRCACVPVTSTSRASSQPLTKPAALCMPSRVDVS